MMREQEPKQRGVYEKVRGSGFGTSATSTVSAGGTVKRPGQRVLPLSSTGTQAGSLGRQEASRELADAVCQFQSTFG